MAKIKKISEHDFEMLQLDVIDRMFLRKVYRSGNNFYMTVHNTCLFLNISRPTYKRMIRRLKDAKLIVDNGRTYRQSDGTFKSTVHYSVDLEQLATYPRIKLQKSERFTPSAVEKNDTTINPATDESFEQPGENSEQPDENFDTTTSENFDTTYRTQEEPNRKNPIYLNGKPKEKEYYLDADDAYNQITTNRGLLRSIVDILQIGNQTDEAKSHIIDKKLWRFLNSTADIRNTKDDFNLHLTRWLNGPKKVALNPYKIQ